MNLEELKRVLNEVHTQLHDNTGNRITSAVTIGIINTVSAQLQPLITDLETKPGDEQPEGKAQAESPALHEAECTAAEEPAA